MRLRLRKQRRIAQQRAQIHGTPNDLPSDLKDLVDIDGDGSIDQDEFKLVRKLMLVQKADVPDIDGDGKIDDEELKLARVLAGKKMLAENFVQNNVGRMWRYGTEFKDRSARGCVDIISGARNYQGLMQFMKTKERIDRLAGSQKVQGVLRHPVTDRPVTFRPRPYDMFLHRPKDVPNSGRWPKHTTGQE